MTIEKEIKKALELAREQIQDTEFIRQEGDTLLDQMYEGVYGQKEPFYAATERFQAEVVPVLANAFSVFGDYVSGESDIAVRVTSIGEVFAEPEEIQQELAYDLDLLHDYMLRVSEEAIGPNEVVDFQSMVYS